MTVWSKMAIKFVNLYYYLYSMLQNNTEMFCSIIGNNYFKREDECIIVKLIYNFFLFKITISNSVANITVFQLIVDVHKYS